TSIGEQNIPFKTVGNFHKLCTIKANLAGVPIPRCFGPNGLYYRVQADIVLLFGVTELKAQIAWVAQNGIEKRGDAEIIYDTDI
ncbi:hypothetical protein P691DRAFT_780239, partial [Macrolepiota fuliginosa MF-IS2]